MMQTGPSTQGATKAPLHTTFLAVARASVPSTPTLNTTIDSDELGEKINLILASMPIEVRMTTLVVAVLFNWLALFRWGRPFTRLNQIAQVRWLRMWLNSRFALFRFAIRALETVVKPVVISNNHVIEQLGSSPTPVPQNPDREPFRLPADRVVRGLSSSREIRVQAVVIGSGAGGAVVAAELAERGIDVAIVEAGRFFSSAELGRDALTNLRETYVQGGTTVALGRPPIPIPLGQTVGGTTTVNSGTCFRTPNRVLTKWEGLGLQIDRSALSAAYDKVEERISVRPVPEHLLGGSSKVIARGSEALGLNHGPLKRNIGSCQMSGMCVFGCPRDAKQSMNVTYVPKALEHGATLYEGFRAETILRKGGKAVGITARTQRGGPILTIHADVVISACGSIGGVPFLRRNGVRSRHLGRHLTIHPALKIAGFMPERIDGCQDTPQGYAIHDLFDEGIMFEGAFLPPELASIAVPFVGEKFTNVMEQFSHLASFGLLVADAPNGRVRVGLGGRPLITYWLSKEDLARLQTGLILLSKVFFAAGAQRIFLPIAGMEEQPTLDAALAALSTPIDPWRIELGAFHPLGTARMSTNRKSGVVTPELETWEIPNLFIADGGIFPSSLGVNPQLTIMAYATMAGQYIASKLGA